MNRIEYPSGLWSERDGNLLTWGKDGNTKKNRFSADDTITDVGAYYQRVIREAGKDPSLFCSAGSEIAAKVLIPEIEACIQFAKDQDAAKYAAEKAVFDAAVESGEAFRVAEIPEQYEAEVLWARKSKPGDGYAEWVIFGFAGSPRVEVEKEAIRKVVAGRKSCGQFPGCSNTAWEISAEEWDKIIALSAEMKIKKEEARRAFDAEEAADVKRKIETGYCFACESYCHGDCGHYSSDPSVKYRRDLKQASQEANYGIND
jgi:hypothetical protein